MSQTINAIALAVCFVALLFLFWIIFNREASHNDTEKVVMEALNEQKAALQISADALMALQNQLAASHGGQLEPQVQGHFMQAAAGLQQAALMSTLAQAKLANQQELLDQIQAMRSGKAQGDQKNSPKPDGGQPTTDKPDANKPAPDKQNTNPQPAPAQPTGNKPDATNSKTNKSPAPAEVKKQ